MMWHLFEYAQRGIGGTIEYVRSLTSNTEDTLLDAKVVSVIANANVEDTTLISDPDTEVLSATTNNPVQTATLDRE